MSRVFLIMSRVIWILTNTYQALKKFRSKPASQMSATHKTESCFVSDMNGTRDRRGEFFEQLYTAESPGGSFQTYGLWPDELKEAVAKLNGGTAAGTCNISTELLKVGG